MLNTSLMQVIYRAVLTLLLTCFAASTVAQNGSNIESKSFDLSYRRSGHESAKPLLAFDDGKSLYLQFQSGREKPAIFAVTFNGPQLVTPKEQGPYAVIDGLPQQLVLVREDSAGQTYRAHVLYTGKRPGQTGTIAPSTFGSVPAAKEFATGKANQANAGTIVQINGGANAPTPGDAAVGTSTSETKNLAAATPLVPLDRVGLGVVDSNYKTSNKAVIVTDNGLATRIRFAEGFDFAAHPIKVISKEPGGDVPVEAKRVGADWILNGLFSNLALNWAESTQPVAVAYAGPASGVADSKVNTATGSQSSTSTKQSSSATTPITTPVFAEPIRPDFALEISDKKLSRALERWAKVSGKELIWLLEVDFPIQTRKSYSTDFLTALDAALEDLNSAPGKPGASYVLAPKSITFLSTN
jgi:hypothetical protein